MANENTIEGKARELNQAVRQELEEQRQAEVVRSHYVDHYRLMHISRTL